ncbi:MAG: hypothetical protein KAI79_14460 [Bacteroidales bacterium]|nr:hypothetical protein [Bacteroidales bacterium]
MNNNLPALRNALLKISQTIDAQIGRGYVSPYPFHQIEEVVSIFKKKEDELRNKDKEEFDKPCTNLLDFTAAYKRKTKMSKN